jgi:hypothetical protein
VQREAAGLEASWRCTQRRRERRISIQKVGKRFVLVLFRGNPSVTEKVFDGF